MYTIGCARVNQINENDRRMLTLESAMWILGRLCIGVFLSVALAAATWVFSRLFLQYVALDTTTIFITQSLIIGIPAGIGAVAAWWNPEAPPWLKLLTAVVTPNATALCAWLTLEIRGVYTYFGLLGGSHRVPVIDIGDLLGTVIVASVVAANALAAVPYLYRLLRHQET